MNAANSELADEKCFLCNSASILHAERMTDRLFGSSGEWSIRCCKNPECGFLWISPKPTPSVLAKAYESYYTHVEKKQESLLRNLYQRFRRGYLSISYGYQDADLTLLDKAGGYLLGCLAHRQAAFDASVMWLDALPGGNLLEIGCGDGERMVLLGSLGWRVQGLEPDQSAAEIASNKGLKVLACTLEETNFPSETFDAVLMSHVIEHLPDPLSAVRECFRILRPGGKLIMLTPNTDGLGHRWYGRDWFHLDPPRHLFLFNRAAMYRLLEGVEGYSRISCRSVVRDAHWTFAASRSLRKNGSYTFGALPMLERVYGLVQLYYEWVLLKINPRVGEELLVIAQK